MRRGQGCVSSSAHRIPGEIHLHSNKCGDGGSGGATAPLPAAAGVCLGLGLSL